MMPLPRPRVAAPWERPLGRVFDTSIATLALLLALPPMLVIALAVALTSRGPVLFRQTRVGRDRREFELLKFRTMKVSNDDSDLRALIAHELSAGEPVEITSTKLDASNASHESEPCCANPASTNSRNSSM